MRVLVNIASLFSLVSALPPNNAALTPAGIQAHPAVQIYKYVADQLQVVITDIKLFEWQTPNTEAIYRHSAEALDTLRKANRLVKEGPELDGWTTLSFSMPLMNLNYQTHQMTSVIKDKYGDIHRADAGLIFYTLLKDTYNAAVEMRKCFVEKEPKYMSSASQGVINEVISNIASTRDTFRPKEGDVTVVVVNPSSPDYNIPPPTYPGTGGWKPPPSTYPPYPPTTYPAPGGPLPYPPYPPTAYPAPGGWTPPNSQSLPKYRLSTR